MVSVSAQAITTPLIIVKPIPICLANGLYFYINFYGEVYILPYNKDGVVGECYVED